MSSCLRGHTEALHKEAHPSRCEMCGKSPNHQQETGLSRPRQMHCEFRHSAGISQIYFSHHVCFQCNHCLYCFICMLIYILCDPAREIDMQKLAAVHCRLSVVNINVLVMISCQHSPNKMIRQKVNLKCLHECFLLLPKIPTLGWEVHGKLHGKVSFISSQALGVVYRSLKRTCKGEKQNCKGEIEKNPNQYLPSAGFPKRL